MKVTGIKSFIVTPNQGKHLLFVKVETDEGIEGWGESYTQSDRVKTVVAHIEDIGRYLIGRDPSNIKHFSQIVYDDFASKRGAIDMFSALSGMEQALWDINGKALGVPVYKLLGGKYRSKVRVYANGWAGGANTSDEELCKRAAALVERGFTAMKFDPYPGPWRTFIDKKDEDFGVRRVKAVREAVGPDVDILIENHRRFSPYHALRIARRMEEFNPYWFEEPVDGMNIDALAYVNHRTDLGVVTGEAMYTKKEFRAVFEAQAADIINPDICNCGGILSIREIGAMAEAYDVAISPHNYNSTTMGLAATVQACATMPNFIITEYFVNFEDLGRLCIKPLELKDGYILLDDSRPGLGVNMNEEALLKEGYADFPMRKLREFYDEM